MVGYILSLIGLLLVILIQCFIVYKAFSYAHCCLIIKTKPGGRYYPISQMWKLKLTECVSKWKQWTQNSRLQVLPSLLAFPSSLTTLFYRTAKARRLDFAFPSLVQSQPTGLLFLLMEPWKIFPNISWHLSDILMDQACTSFQSTFDLLHPGLHLSVTKHPGLSRIEGQGTFSTKTGITLGKARQMVTL